jgi:hypothetical protein
VLGSYYGELRGVMTIGGLFSQICYKLMMPQDDARNYHNPGLIKHKYNNPHNEN